MGSIIIWVIVVASPKSIADLLQSPQLTQDNIKATPQNPLFIDGNQNFSTMAANEGWSGAGTKLNPFNITGLEIVNSSVHLIEIQNTNMHFLITGNTLDGISKANEGIILTNVSNGKIMNNVINHTFVGIRLSKATNITVSGNEISHSRTAGIFSSSSESLEIIGNTITKNGDEDALVQLELPGAGNGIHCRYTHSSVIKDNQLIKNLYECISLSFCSWNVVQENTLSETTFKWQGEFHASGIGVWDLSEYNNISYNTVYSMAQGISTNIRSNHNFISYNNIYDNYRTGIELFGTNNTVSYNILHDNPQSIYLGWAPDRWSEPVPAEYAEDCLIAHNQIYNNSKAIEFRAGKDTIVRNNSIYSNSNYGIVISNISTGNTIKWNDFIGNGDEDSQAMDDGTSNTFISNYWYTYETESPYEIAGAVGNSDSSPLASKNNADTPVFPPPEPKSTPAWLILSVIFFLGVVTINRKLKSRK